MWNRNLGILFLALSLGGAATLPASAQNVGEDRTGADSRPADDGFNLGWLGLIGLAGLLGLRRREDATAPVNRVSR